LCVGEAWASGEGRRAEVCAQKKSPVHTRSGDAVHGSKRTVQRGSSRRPAVWPWATSPRHRLTRRRGCRRRAPSGCFVQNLPLTDGSQVATPRCTCPEGYRQLLETNDNGTRRSSSTNLTNAHSNANVANAVPLDGRKVILKFCIRYLGCDHGKSCYCCQQAQENCYDTLEECHDNCPACDPTCPPLQSSPGSTVKDLAINATS